VRFNGTQTTQASINEVEDQLVDKTPVREIYIPRSERLRTLYLNKKPSTSAARRRTPSPAPESDQLENESDAESSDDTHQVVREPSTGPHRSRRLEKINGLHLLDLPSSYKRPFPDNPSVVEWRVQAQTQKLYLVYLNKGPRESAVSICWDKHSKVQPV
jgi:hypothetical protein